MVSRQPTLRFVLGYVNVITICFLSVHVHLFETMNKIKYSEHSKDSQKIQLLHMLLKKCRGIQFSTFLIYQRVYIRKT